MKLLEAVSLSTTYGKKRSWFTTQAGAMQAVHNVSLSLEQGETLGLVGESGSGKSTLGRLLLGLEKPTSGKVLYRGQDITGLSLKQMRSVRHRMQMIFQNSLSAFNPLFTVEQIIGEPLRNYRVGTAEARREKVLESLERVGLSRQYMRRYPHELSGGQQQRVGIARAIVLGPELLICDEPFSSLDATLRRQMLNLLLDLKSQLGLSYVFITHDLSLVDRFCDHVAVMHQGQIVEWQRSECILQHAIHPYTRSLLESVPIQDPRLRQAALF
ncbi:dipeptide/oligopeptide/nickel ABC transporter ATP-binding protein [Bacillus sp. FJAT-27264]|uniref:ATP-binding cassette domain-containing protein n=1 Tax=Paenibacillus sp. (strain DSM 101736 / FJAT-27264) TaxID=1850362 RepID=UPI000807A35B|nr:ABC transporter ATP-binding protein [Bacillus sp. FJAT-27264]OBZ19029.1 dipeptide/oligopeptide/nickel ABC transporter ATP-binding protein [Bacillus sp. FJAT-27264]